MNAAVAGRRKLLTLGELAQRAGVSMSTVNRYKKHHAERIPSEGEGRRMRYPLTAVKAIRQINRELAGNRGNRKKKAPAARADSGAPDLLTLTSIREQTGISYPTLQRYVKLYLEQIPHEGEGRKRRYHPDSVAVFRQLRAESRRGGAAVAAGKAGQDAGAAAQLLTLAEVGKQARISGPTLQRYLKLHLNQIPHEGEGRKRRYHPEAVAAFRELRARSGRRGRRPAAAKKATGAEPGTSRRAAVSSQPAGDVEARLAALEEQVRLVLRKLDQPFKLTLTR